jgi:hypothetical protein
MITPLTSGWTGLMAVDTFRIKLTIHELVSQMLDQIPDHVWKSDSTTFLDPAMAGGQFILEIERRLKAAGHSDENIANRVWGCEERSIRVKYVQNWHKALSQHLYVRDAITHEWDHMKFDVIVGNPPYQNGNEKGGARSLWRRFVSKSFELCKDNGYVSLITPGCPFKSADLGSYFTDYQTEKVYTDIAQHFPGVGSTFTAWITHKVPRHKLTEYPDLDVSVDFSTRIHDKVFDLVTENILAKIETAKAKFGTLDCRQDKGYSSNDLHTAPDKYGEHPHKSRPFKVRHANKIEYCWGNIATECHYKSKVMMTFSGYPNFKYHGKTDPVSSCYQMSGYILVPNAKQGANLIGILNLSVNKFERLMTSKGGFTGVDTYKHVNLDVTQSWTDAEYFDLLGLTTEERAWVLDNI